MWLLHEHIPAMTEVQRLFQKDDRAAGLALFYCPAWRDSVGSFALSMRSSISSTYLSVCPSVPLSLSLSACSLHLKTFLFIRLPAVHMSIFPAVRIRDQAAGRPA